METNDPNISIISMNSYISIASLIFMKFYQQIIILIIFSLLIFFSTFNFALRLYRADYFYKQVVKSKINSDFKEMFLNYQKVFAYAPNEIFYQKKYADDLVLVANFLPEKEKIFLLNQAIEKLEEINQKKEIFQYTWSLANLLSLKANSTKNKQDFEKAEKTFKHLNEISPYYPIYYKDWVKLEIFKEDFENAEKLCFQALSVLPPASEPHKERKAKERAEIYEFLGQIYFKKNELEKAVEAYQEALKLAPLSKINLHKKIADIYYLQGSFDKAIERNLHGYHLNPQDPVWSFALSFLYQEKGEGEQAKKWAKICADLKPEDAEIKELIAKILND